VIYTHNQTNAFRLNGSLTMEMFNRKVKMAFEWHLILLKAVEGLLSFTNMSGHQSTWRGQERDIGESEMNSLKHH